MAFIRSAGPGGQNVNKVASAVQLRFALDGNTTLRADVKTRLRALAGQRRHRRRRNPDHRRAASRSQEQNRREAEDRLLDLVLGALVVPKKRHATKPTRASKERRLNSKTRSTKTKRLRGRSPQLRLRRVSMILWREKLLASGPLRGHAGARGQRGGADLPRCGIRTRSSSWCGGRELFMLVVGCDLALGPLLSLVVFDSSKTRRELLFDYTVLGIVQLAGLVYGV